MVNVWRATAGLSAEAVGWLPAEMAGQAAMRLDAEASKRGEQLAAEGAALAERAGLDAEPRALRSDAKPWAAISDCASELDASGVVAGSRGLSGLSAPFLGSVSYALVHHCQRPVLVVNMPNQNEPPHEPAGPALLCYDGSSSARHALEEAGHLFGGGKAIVLCVWQTEEVTVVPDSFAERSEFGRDVDEMTEEVVATLDARVREGAEQTAREGAEIAEAVGLTAQARSRRAITQFGGRGSTTVWKAVLEEAGEQDSGVVVVGTRGRSTVSSSILGSVSSGVLHHRTGPTLVVPQPAR